MAAMSALYDRCHLKRGVFSEVSQLADMTFSCSLAIFITFLQSKNQMQHPPLMFRFSQAMQFECVFHGRPN